jgi:hypothetical protein
MKKITKSNIVAYALTIILVLIIAVQATILLSENQSKPIDPLAALWSGNYTSDKKFWKERIDNAGTDVAYEEFKAATQGKDFGVAHTLAHIMGELIYEKEGIEGVANCDSTFAFGCYHSFFGKAISENGIGVVESLDQACIRKWGEKGLGCPHGIGHGVQGYYGDEKLIDALEVCTKLNWKEPIGGCTSGVFMEFNFHTMESFRAENRKLDPENPHYPCNEVPDKFRQACYFEQAQWWAQVVDGGYAQLGVLCKEVNEKSALEACFRGIGNTIAPSTKYNSTETIASCALMPGDEEELLCREGASWSFYAEPSARDRVGEVCIGLGEVRSKRCLIGFDLAKDRI